MFTNNNNNNNGKYNQKIYNNNDNNTTFYLGVFKDALCKILVEHSKITKMINRM